MPHICPRPCTRLATAAVFISVGVVQFVVGIILLRSKYVYLLAGPDFWTSICNIAVGCLLGLSASVWKQSKKQQSRKHFIRRNLLLALLFSSLIMNATTLAILLLGEGNTLLSIRLESNGIYSQATFAGEVLAYAYVTSVCCPVVCIVISIVSMSGSCYSSVSRKDSMEMRNSLNSLKKNRSRSLQLIYTPELLGLAKKKKLRELVVTSTSESSPDEDDDYDSDIPVQQKQSDSVEELQRVLNRMAQGKRDAILSDSAIMLRQLDHRRKNRYDSLNKDGSYIGPVLSRMREAALDEKRTKEALSLYDDLTHSEMGNPKRHTFDESASSSPEGITLESISILGNKRSDKLHRNPYTEELIKEYKNASHLATKNRNFKEEFQAGSEVDGTMLDYTSNANDYRNRSTTYKKSRKTSEIKTKDKCISAEHIHRKRYHESPLDNRQMICEEERSRCFKASKANISPVQNDCFSPDESEFGEDSTPELSRASTWAGDVIPINTSHLARLSPKLVPVANPVVPSQQLHELRKTSDDSGISTIESNSFNTEENNQNEFKDRKGNLSSFREDSKTGSKENMQEYPKMGSQSTKKYDLSRVATMASISEEPNLELIQSEPRPHCSSLCEAAIPRISKKHLRKQSLPSLFSESSKQTRRGEESSRMNTTPKRKRNASGKTLKKMWSMDISDSQTDIFDKVVDVDSLIGLSEEELIARQLRNRSIRKVIQQRIKEEMMV